MYIYIYIHIYIPPPGISPALPEFMIFPYPMDGPSSQGGSKRQATSNIWLLLVGTEWVSSRAI